jgi:alkylation response protein AidB-like acyl-CoA dehydrogenase
MLAGKPVALNSEELITRVQSLIPLLRSNANVADRLGHVPDENVRAIEEAGLLRMLMPVNRDGYWTDAARAATAMTHIASGCPSTAWVLQIYSGIGRMAEVFPGKRWPRSMPRRLTPGSPALGRRQLGPAGTARTLRRTASTTSTGQRPHLTSTPVEVLPST